MHARRAQQDIDICRRSEERGGVPSFVCPAVTGGLTNLHAPGGSKEGRRAEEPAPPPQRLLEAVWPGASGAQVAGNELLR